MIKEIDITNPTVAKEVLAIQLDSYKVEAKIIGTYELPPLRDNVEKLQNCEETFFGYYLNEELCGVISIQTTNKVMDIHRLMVHPSHFKKGIAGRLLRFIEKKHENYETIIVSTGSKNTPAVNFYLKNGFSKTGETKITEHLSITSFEKKHSRIQ